MLKSAILEWKVLPSPFTPIFCLLWYGTFYTLLPLIIFPLISPLFLWPPNGKCQRSTSRLYIYCFCWCPLPFSTILDGTNHIILKLNSNLSNYVRGNPSPPHPVFPERLWKQKPNMPWINTSGSPLPASFYFGVSGNNTSKSLPSKSQCFAISPSYLISH